MKIRHLVILMSFLSVAGTGTFAMHGRPIDVINDPVSNQPLVLQDFRARTYLPQYGRWLQRDSLGNVDGPNLYEAFKGNSLSNLDPRGEGVITLIMGVGWSSSDSKFIGDFGRDLYGRADKTVQNVQTRAEKRFDLMLADKDNPLFANDGLILFNGVLMAVGDILPSGKFAEAATGLSTGYSEELASNLSPGVRISRAGWATAETAMWSLASREAGQAIENSAIAARLEVRFLGATGGRLRLGLISEGRLLGVLETEQAAAVGIPALRIGAENLAAATVEPLSPIRLGAANRGIAAADTIPVGQRITLYYPLNRGFLSNPTTKTLQPGIRIDRFGFEGGTFTAPAGTSVPMRALPPSAIAKPYNIYEVVKPIDVKAGPAMPWFNQLGLGTQYEMPSSIGQLIEQGYLIRVGG